MAQLLLLAAVALFFSTVSPNHTSELEDVFNLKDFLTASKILRDFQEDIIGIMFCHNIF